jgi:hypothetical protein
MLPDADIERRRKLYEMLCHALLVTIIGWIKGSDGDKRIQQAYAAALKVTRDRLRAEGLLQRRATRRRMIEADNDPLRAPDGLLMAARITALNAGERAALADGISPEQATNLAISGALAATWHGLNKWGQANAKRAGRRFFAQQPGQRGSPGTAQQRFVVALIPALEAAAGQKIARGGINIHGRATGPGIKVVAAALTLYRSAAAAGERLERGQPGRKGELAVFVEAYELVKAYRRRHPA